MKPVLAKIIALVMAPAAALGAQPADDERALRDAAAEGSVEAYARLALDHPHLSEEARRRIESGATVSARNEAAKPTDEAGLNPFIRDFQIV